MPRLRSIFQPLNDQWPYRLILQSIPKQQSRCVLEIYVKFRQSYNHFFLGMQGKEESMLSKELREVDGNNRPFEQYFRIKPTKPSFIVIDRLREDIDYGIQTYLYLGQADKQSFFNELDQAISQAQKKENKQDYSKLKVLVNIFKQIELIMACSILLVGFLQREFFTFKTIKQKALFVIALFVFINTVGASCAPDSEVFPFLSNIVAFLNGLGFLVLAIYQISRKFKQMKQFYSSEEWKKDYKVRTSLSVKEKIINRSIFRSVSEMSNTSIAYQPPQNTDNFFKFCMETLEMNGLQDQLNFVYQDTIENYFSHLDKQKLDQFKAKILEEKQRSLNSSLRIGDVDLKVLEDQVNIALYQRTYIGKFNNFMKKQTEKTKSLKEIITNFLNSLLFIAKITSIIAGYNSFQTIISWILTSFVILCIALLLVNCSMHCYNKRQYKKIQQQYRKSQNQSQNEERSSQGLQRSLQREQNNITTLKKDSIKIQNMSESGRL